MLGSEGGSYYADERELTRENAKAVEQCVLEGGRRVDTFVVYTDSETWAGDIHPVQSLRAYRAASGIDPRLIVVGMVSNGFSIADPSDPGMLDVVGFDTATPQLISDFASGAL